MLYFVARTLPPRSYIFQHLQFIHEIYFYAFIGTGLILRIYVVYFSFSWLFFGYVVLLLLSLLKEGIRQADRPQVFYAITTVLDKHVSQVTINPHKNRLTAPMSTKCNS